jgi:hypothetical protein
MTRTGSQRHSKKKYIYIYIYIYINTHSSKYRDAVWAKEIKKIGLAVNSACHFGHAYHWYVNAALRCPLHQYCHSNWRKEIVKASYESNKNNTVL